MALKGIQLSSSVITGASKPIDAKYGPFNSVAEAEAEVTDVLRYQGLTVGIIDQGSVVDYWWRDGILDADLVLKSTGGGGGNGLLRYGTIHVYDIAGSNLTIGPDDPNSDFVVTQRFGDLPFSEENAHYFTCEFIDPLIDDNYNVVCEVISNRIGTVPNYAEFDDESPDYAGDDIRTMSSDYTLMTPLIRHKTSTGFVLVLPESRAATQNISVNVRIESSVPGYSIGGGGTGSTPQFSYDPNNKVLTITNS